MSVKKNERKTAVNILLTIKIKGTAAAETININLLKDGITDRRSKAFILKLVYGTLENIIYIDSIINSFSKKPVKKMNPKIVVVLESAVYQMLFLNSVPVSAVCNESVKLVQAMALSPLKGFVNAILRNIARNKDNIDGCVGLIDANSNTDEYMSLKYSVPEWIINRWIDQFGDNTSTMINALRKPSDIFIRCNTDLISKDNLKKELEKEGIKVGGNPSWPEYALVISNIDGIEEISAFKDGLFYIQDISCIKSVEQYPLKAGDEVLDMCASPGGKSIGTALSLKSLGGGKVVSCDVSSNKTARIEENIKRMHLQDIVEIKTVNALEHVSDHQYDVVIADVPCMGLGIIGRKPDILLNRKEEDVESIVKLQRQIIKAGISKVKAGGHFIFSTCSLLKEENEEQSEWIKETSGMNKIYECLQIPGINTEGTGFYTAIFKKDIRE